MIRLALLLALVWTASARAAELAPLDGGPARTLAEIANGRPVVLHLWATWCAPCREELPALDRFAGDGGKVVAVSVDTRSPESVARWLDELGVDLRGWLDVRRALPTRFGVRAYPTTLLLDEEGREVSRIVGPVAWDDPAMRAGMNAHVEGAETDARAMPVRPKGRPPHRTATSVRLREPAG